MDIDFEREREADGRRRRWPLTLSALRKRSFYAALAGAGAMGMTGAAQAVNVNPDGLGQVLLYPYYTVQEPVPGSPYASLLSVVNMTPSIKAVRVRFLEGRHSRELLDFNLFLSPRDVWTAAVLPAGAGAGVATYDRSCTVPVVSNNPGALTAFSKRASPARPPPAWRPTSACRSSALPCSRSPTAR